MTSAAELREAMPTTVRLCGGQADEMLATAHTDIDLAGLAAWTTARPFAPRVFPGQRGVAGAGRDRPQPQLRRGVPHVGVPRRPEDRREQAVASRAATGKMTFTHVRCEPVINLPDCLIGGVGEAFRRRRSGVVTLRRPRTSEGPVVAARKRARRTLLRDLVSERQALSPKGWRAWRTRHRPLVTPQDQQAGDIQP